MADEDGTKTSRAVIVRVPVETHRAIRIRVAEEDKSMQQWTYALIERELARRPQLARSKSAGKSP